MQIYKYPVPLETDFSIEMPYGAVILSFQCQKNKLMLWALVDTGFANIKRQFKLLGTGQSIERESIIKYIGSTQMDDGLFVWHLFEVF